MIIYQLSLNNYAPFVDKSMNLEYRLIDNTWPVDNLKIDTDFMLNAYNFKISEAEIVCFKFHYRAWNEFSKSSSDWCLIIEDQTKINFKLSEIVSIISEFPENCDVFFPFDKTGAIGFGKPYHEPYILGFQWGSYAYFLNKIGVMKLLQISTIRQPVDEEILSLSLKGEINSFSAPTTFFDGGEWQRIKEERHNAILQAILSSNAWLIDDKKKVQNILLKLVKICVELKINIILDSGTLLGYVRHGEIMPWDDDVDLAVHEKDVARIIEFIDNYGGLSYGKFKWPKNGCDYYKFWLKDGEKIEGHEHKFPFVDVWLYYLKDEEVIFNHGVVFKKDEFYPFKKALFENQEVLIPSNPILCLDKIYPTWKSMIHVYPWSHRKEKSYFYPLSTSISVNENGRMLM